MPNIDRADERKIFYRQSGERMRMMRRLLGISEREAAEAMGTSVRTYRKWEMGGLMRGYWTERLCDYCDAYGVSFGWLACGDGNFLPDDDYLRDLRTLKELFPSEPVTDAGTPFVTPVKH
jgi:transcriptional regulator with XRE-family HTH domain